MQLDSVNLKLLKGMKLMTKGTIGYVTEIV